MAKEREYKGLIKSFAKSPYMKELYKDLVEAKKDGDGMEFASTRPHKWYTGNKIHYNGEVTDVIDESYGGLIVKWIFKLFDYNEVEEGEFVNFVAANWRPTGLTSGFKSAMDWQIAQWFLLGRGSTNINDLFEVLQDEYHHLLETVPSKFDEVFRKASANRQYESVFKTGIKLGMGPTAGGTTQ